MLVYKIREFGKKYEDASTSDDTLFKQILYFANPNDFEDPFDRFILPNFPKLESEDEIEMVANKITEIHIGYTDLISFFKYKNVLKEKLRNRDNFISQFKDLIRRENNNYGICSFTKDWNQPKNWINYGKLNSGFAIGFELKDLTKSPFLSYADDVKYLKEYPKISLVDYFPSNSSNPLEWYTNVLSKTFFIKSIDWQHENEWRAVQSFVGLNSINRKLNFQPQIIKEIILGFNVKSEDMEKVISFSSIYDIPVYKTILADNSFELKRNKIN